MLEKYIIIFSLFSVILVPDSSSIPRLENFIMVIVLILLLYKKQLKINAYSMILLLLFISTFISSILNFTQFSNVLFTYRFLKLFLFFLLVYQNSFKYINTINKTISILFITCSIINLFIVFQLPGFNLISYIYLKQSQIDSSGIRLFGTMGNPNDNALLWIFFVCYFLSQFNYNGKKRNLLFVFISSVFIVLCQSRTVFLGLATIVLVYLLLSGVKKNLFYIILLIIIGFLTLGNLNLEYLNQIFNNNPLEISSLTERFTVWDLLLKMWKEKAIFGWGPYKEFFALNGIYPDGEYVLFLFSYGIVGFILLCLVFLYPIINFFIKRKNSPISILGIILPIGMAFGAYTNFIINNVRISLLFIVCIGIVSSLNQRPYSSSLKQAK